MVLYTLKPVVFYRKSWFLIGAHYVFPIEAHRVTCKYNILRQNSRPSWFTRDWYLL